MRHAARCHVLVIPLVFAIVFVGLSPLVTTSGGRAAVPDDPMAVATPEAASREVVLATGYDALLAIPTAVTLTRLTFPPGSRAAGDGATGPRLLIVETQAITVTVSATALVLRAPAPRASSVDRSAGEPGEAVPPATEVVLQTGDGLTTGQPLSELRNDGERPSEILIAEVVPIAAGTNGFLPLPIGGAPIPTPAATASGTPSAVTVRPFQTAEGVLVQPLAGGAAPAPSPGPGEVRLDRLTLPPGQEVPLAVQPGPWLLLVESGTLGLAAWDGQILFRSSASANPGAVPGRLKTAEVGSEVLLTAGGMAFLQPAAEADLRNRGRGTVILLALTVVPARNEVVLGPLRQS
jgi:hypothetical protein